MKPPTPESSAGVASARDTHPKVPRPTSASDDPRDRFASGPQIQPPAMLSASLPPGQSRIRRQWPTLRASFGYVLPRDFMYLPDFRSPMREAFFLTASVGRPSRDATSAVARLGKRCRSCLMSSFDQTPLTSFFLAISRLLSAYLTHCGLDMQFRILAASHGTIKYFSRFGRKNIAVLPGVVTACTARPRGRFGYCHPMVVARRAGKTMGRHGNRRSPWVSDSSYLSVVRDGLDTVRPNHTLLGPWFRGLCLWLCLSRSHRMPMNQCYGPSVETEV